MKPILALAAFICLFSTAAHAQAAGGGAIPVNRTNSGGGGGGYGGGSTVNFPTPPHYPSTVFVTAGVSGTSSDFVPSQYLPYDQAVAAGQSLLNSKQKTVVEMAQESKNASGSNSKHVIVQDSDGNLVQQTHQ